jgi:hypothetical protein
MRYKIELKYTYGWDDAGWTDETRHKVEPVRFASAAEAHLALREYFEFRKAAVADGNMDSDAESSGCRIVESDD